MSNERYERIIRIMRTRNVTYMAAARVVDAEDPWGRRSVATEAQA